MRPVAAVASTLLISLTLALAQLVVAPAQAGGIPLLDAVGANDWSCRTTAAHPHPVVLVHGTFGDKKTLLDRLSWRLHRTGYCVYALDYGRRATGPIAGSARELSAFVDRVLSATGAAKVDLVGHSQGGMMPRYYIKDLGGAGKVDDLVGLAPSNHGTSNPLTLFPGLGYWCAACLEQRTGSTFLTRLNAGDETPGPVSYTTIVTSHDRVVTPYTSGYLAGATNIRLQDKCRYDPTGHVWMPMDGPVIRIVLNALGRRGPADPAYRPSCLP